MYFFGISYLVVNFFFCAEKTLFSHLIFKLIQKKISELMAKYNDILLVSVRLAINEDFTNLVILNRDDTDF